MPAYEYFCASPPPHRNKRSECLDGAARCPGRPTAGQMGTVSYLALSDCDGLQREENSPAPPGKRKQRSVYIVYSVVCGYLITNTYHVSPKALKIT